MSDVAGRPELVDGRHARRERNREAVVEALLALYRDGHLQPSTDEIAQRAGLSPRSLFRYFDDVDELCRIAIQRQRDRVGHLVAAEIDPGLDLAGRALALVRQRLDLYDAMSWVGVVARSRAPYQPLIADELRAIRATLRAQLQLVFAAELADPPASAAGRVAAIDVLCSFEAYRLMLDDQGLPRDRIETIVADALVELVAPRPG